MANSRRQITVTNLPPAITEVDLELLFESRSFCPDGGDVACVKVDDDTHTAIITLEDEDGMLQSMISHHFCLRNCTKYIYIISLH